MSLIFSPFRLTFFRTKPISVLSGAELRLALKGEELRCRRQGIEFHAIRLNPFDGNPSQFVNAIRASLTEIDFVGVDNEGVIIVCPGYDRQQFEALARQFATAWRRAGLEHESNVVSTVSATHPPVRMESPVRDSKMAAPSV